MKISVLKACLFLTGLSVVTLTACNADKAPKAENENVVAVETAKQIFTGSLDGFDTELVHVISAKAGQTVMVAQKDAGENRVSFNITDSKGENVSDMEASCNNNQTFKPVSTGDYTVKVWECMKADPWTGTYTLVVTVK